MDCHKAQEEILESFEVSGPPGIQRDVDAHLAGCLACARFAASQKTVDVRLSAMLTPPEMSSAFRSILLKRIRRERKRFRSNALPDVVHFASCAVATVFCAVLVPFDAAVVFGVGTIAALLTYVPLTMIQDLFQDVEHTQRP